MRAPSRFAPPLLLRLSTLGTLAIATGLGCSVEPVAGIAVAAQVAASEAGAPVAASGSTDVAQVVLPAHDAGASSYDVGPDSGAGEFVHLEAGDQLDTGAALDVDAGCDGGPAFPGWTWTGIIGTGQSLAVGVLASTVTLTSQPFLNLKLSLGDASVTVPPYDPMSPSLSLVPLVEPIRPELQANIGYPFNIYGETPHTAIGDQISTLFQSDTGGDYVTVHTVVGENAEGINVIGKSANPTANTGHAYAASLFEVAAIQRLAVAAGKTYGVGAVVLTHGEADGSNPDYAAAVYKLVTDYNADITAITKQTRPVPMLLTQQQVVPGDTSTPYSLMAEWQLGRDHPNEIVCVGPKYQYPYASDHVHLVAIGYDRLGEKYGEVYYERVVLGHDWQPLQPETAALRDNVITVEMHVPSEPMVFDESLPAPHQTVNTQWSAGHGFEVANRSGAQTIISVNIEGDAVVLTLAAMPDPADLVVRYAMTQDGQGSLGGLASGRIGQLRDSDPLVGYATQAHQYNYAVSFTLPVVSASEPN